MTDKNKDEICEVLPIFKRFAHFLMLFVVLGYVWGIISYPHESLTDFVMPALMWSFVAIPLLMVAKKMGSGVCIRKDRIEYVGVLGGRKGYTWKDIKRIRLAAGRSKLRYAYVEFNNKNRIIFSNRQIGFWRAAKMMVSLSESQNVFLAYEFGDKGKYWMWDGEEGGTAIL